MNTPSILIANRGEIAIRIARACADLGMRSVAVHLADDARALHVLRADAAQLLPGRGAAAYLDVAQAVAAAQAAGCSAVHPGYGFLSESEALAEACAKAGLVFIGPSAEVLRLFGDKAARFMQLCEAHGLPVVSLCDTAGFMVGPEAEKTAQVRRVARMFVGSASLSVPLAMVVLRKGYGLGAMAMAGGDFQDTVFTVSWPTGEFGGMGLEGAVRLAWRKELAAIADPQAQQAEFERRVAQMYAHGKALSMASVVEIDDVIDPADTRRWITSGLQSAARERPARSGRRRAHIETW